MPALGLSSLQSFQSSDFSLEQILEFKHSTVRFNDIIWQKIRLNNRYNYVNIKGELLSKFHPEVICSQCLWCGKTESKYVCINKSDFQLIGSECHEFYEFDNKVIEIKKVKKKFKFWPFW
jgi:hypothetical protein